MDIQNFDNHSATSGHVFFERGVLDALCGLDHITPLTESELSTWFSKYPYFPKVFILPPWKEIYVNDAERDHTFGHAEMVYSILLEWYRRCPYQLIELPRISVEERCILVLRELESGLEEKICD